MNTWEYQNTDISSADQLPANTIGFVYMITNVTKDKYYIGKKSIYAKRTLPPLKNTKKKRVIQKESDWLSYIGSNRQLQEDIKNGNIINKKILKVCTTKKQLTYYELSFLVHYNVLLSDRSYNDNILGKFFRRDLIIG